MKLHDEVYKQVADGIMASLGLNGSENESVQIEKFSKWMKNWKTYNPQNGDSKREYKGSNAFFLSILMDSKGWKMPFFFTKSGIQKQNALIKAGEKSNPIFWWEFKKMKDKRTGDEKTIPMFRVFAVWNIEQTTIDPENYKMDQKNIGSIEDIDKMVEKLNPTIEYTGFQPCYIPALDKIQMPEKGFFNSTGDFYSVLFHEMGHWTKTKERTNRIEKGLNYAQEELVAELTSAFLSKEFGLEGKMQHVEYIGSWIRGLKEQPKEFINAVTMAMNAAKFIKGEKAEKVEKIEENEAKIA